jgi:GNAT superfamily N-acetyltransferase
LCPVHARLEVTGPRGEAPRPPVTVRPAADADRERIVSMADAFWDETEVDCFGRVYAVGDLPAFVACDDSRVVGVASYAVEAGAVNLVMLNVEPLWQGRGVAGALVEALTDQARVEGATRLIVATTNDDLPALAFYQRLGFVITEILPGRMLEEHGFAMAGFSGIYLRDEIQLEMAI